jgi:hypothetical protein
MRNEIVGTGAPLPRLVAARPLEGRKVELTWRGGRKKIVDLAPAFVSRRIYIPLREDDRLFATLRVSEYGDAIEWDGSLDFSSVWLDRLPAVDFDNADFRQAMTDLDMSLEGMAAQLEISRRLVADYRKDKPIPRHIALATRYLVEQKSRRAG